MVNQVSAPENPASDFYAELTFGTWVVIQVPTFWAQLEPDVVTNSHTYAGQDPTTVVAAIIDII